jgi:hypothetical protein
MLPRAVRRFVRRRVIGMLCALASVGVWSDGAHESLFYLASSAQPGARADRRAAAPLGTRRALRAGGRSALSFGAIGSVHLRDRRLRTMHCHHG